MPACAGVASKRRELSAKSVQPTQIGLAAWVICPKAVVEIEFRLDQFMSFAIAVSFKTIYVSMAISVFLFWK